MLAAHNWTNLRKMLVHRRLGAASVCRSQLRQAYQQKPAQSNTETTLLRTLWHKAFGKYLLATNIVSSGVLMVIGDICAQEIEYRRSPPAEQRYDMTRIGRMFIVGALLGPLHHYVYNWMDRIWPVPTVKNNVKKILVDQFVMSPACIIMFFYSACFLERKTFKETNIEMLDKFSVIYLIDWLFWPGAQYLNFRYLNLKYRVFFVNICTAVYNIFMSHMKHDFHGF